MISCKLSLAAEGVVRDADNDSLSVFTILEGIQPMGFPFFLQRVAFLALWERLSSDLQDYKGKIVFENNDKKILEQDAEVNFRGALRHRTLLRAGGLVVTEPGILRISFILENSVTASYSIRIEPSPQVAEAPASQLPR